MKKSHITKSLLALTVTTAVPLVSITAAMADTNFDNQYQTNASQEASLLQTAQASGVTSSYISSLSNTVQTINNQITTLYNTEQELAGAEASIPQIDDQNFSSMVKQLNQKRQQLLNESQLAWANVNQYFHRHDKHGKDMYNQFRGNWSEIGNQLADVDSQLAQLNEEEGPWQSASDKGFYDGGLTSLQDSILKLQTAAIHYTKEWIALEQNGGTESTTIAAPTNLEVSNVTNSGWTVSWMGVSGASSYNVYLNGNEIASNVTDTSYTFTGENSNTNYTVTVTAVNSANNVSVQSSAVGITTSTDAYLLSVPTNLAVSNVTNSGWSVSWVGAPGASSYNVYLNGNEIASNVTDTSYTFSGENPNTNYTVAITAVNSANNASSQSASISVTTLN